MDTESTALTEKDAATAYASAWNRLDCTEFLKLLSPDAHYASQWVFEELESKAAVTDYLKKKMIAVRNCGTKVFAELGRTQAGCAGRDCVFMAQGRKEEIYVLCCSRVRRGRERRMYGASKRRKVRKSLQEEVLQETKLRKQ